MEPFIIMSDYVHMTKTKKWPSFSPTTAKIEHNLSCPRMAHCHPTDLSSGTYNLYDSAKKPKTTNHFQVPYSTA